MNHLDYFEHQIEQREVITEEILPLLSTGGDYFGTKSTVGDTIMQMMIVDREGNNQEMVSVLKSNIHLTDDFKFIDMAREFPRFIKQHKET